MRAESETNEKSQETKKMFKHIQTKSYFVSLRSLWQDEQSHSDSFPCFQLLKCIKSSLNAFLYFTCVINKVAAVAFCDDEWR